MRQGIDEARVEIIGLLRDWHRGPARAIPRHELLNILRLRGHLISDRTLRRIYTGIKNVGYSCGGPRRGLYWTDDEGEIREVIERERGRGLACMVRGSEMRRNLERRGQGTLFPGLGSRA